jgi:D-alanyl-lipoteichoic acid acyltransferase DltB (MBOAT superfamily)
MSFISIDFAILLAICLALYAVLERRAQNVVLLLASYVFYGAWDVRFLLLLWLSTGVDFFVSHRIARADAAGDAKLKLRWLRVSLCTSLGILGFFKYFGFFAGELQAALARAGVAVDLPTLHVVLPVGISFYTFQSISYAVDVYRGAMRPARSLLDFATFIAFFPQLVAGPIERAKHMVPQFENPRVVTVGAVREGVWLMLFGYARKVVIADTAAHFCAPRFEHPDKFTSLELICGLLLFAIQIYGDFAGYTDIARGTARLFGFQLMRNFEHPYFARNVSDFWRRWHISLSTWLRDYLYVPLGGNRRGELRTYANLMITMLLGGLWHGASWNFLIWGGLHGLYLCVHRKLRGALSALSGALRGLSPLLTAAGVLATFCLVCFTWLFFRSTSFDLTLAYLRGLSALDFGGAKALGPVALLSALTLAIDLPQALSNDELRVARTPRLVRIPIAAAVLVLLVLSGDSGQPFIYFQF